MLWAAPVAGLASALTVPLLALAEDAAPTDPRQMAVAFGMTLLASWAMLLGAKVWEGSPRPNLVRRQSAMFVLGSLIGLVGFGLVEATHLGPLRGGYVFREMFGVATSRWTAAAEFAMAFGVSFLMFPWWGILGRARGRRFRLWPIGFAALSGGTIGMLFPDTLPLTPLSLALALTVTQFVSPWSREASEYARQSKRRAA